MPEEAGDAQIGTLYPWIGRIGNILLAGYLVLVVSSFFLLPTLRAGLLFLTDSGISIGNTQNLSSLLGNRVEVLTYFVLPFLVGVVFLACGLYVYLVRRTHPSGRVFSVFASASAFTLAGFFALINSSTRFALLWLLSMTLAAGALLHLAIIFPREMSWVLKKRYLSWIGYLPAAVLCLFLVSSIIKPGPLPVYIYLMGFAILYLLFTTLCFTAVEGLRSYRSASPVICEQARLVFISALISFLPIYVWFLA